MNISYYDDARVTESQMKRKERELKDYRTKIAEAESKFDLTIPESSLYYPKDAELHEAISEASRRSRRLKYVLLVGIGGQSLDVEAVHEALSPGKIKLLVLDTVSVSRMCEIKEALKACKKVTEIAVCISSKSGTTTETRTNAAIILDYLEDWLGIGIYKQTYFIGTEGTDFLRQGKKLGSTCLIMPTPIGGRFSIGTVAGLVPLALLGHDTDNFIEGYLDALSPTLESVVTESAARLAIYHDLLYPHYNFFAFESRLEKLGFWYRQLIAESLGKEFDISGKPAKLTMLPAISTPTELHSVGQLYMSGVLDVYTDFVSFDDEELDVMIPKKTKIAKELKELSLQEVATAIYGGVIGAYQEKQLPYRATLFEDDLPYSIGQFMAMRLREVMYTAKLLKRNAFDQPNVELYKEKTRDILFV